MGLRTHERSVYTTYIGACMILYFRFLINLIWHLLRGKSIDPHKPLDISFRVLPTDIDFNLHMNNARYASFMDIAIFQFMVQTHIFHHMRALGGVPVKRTTFFRFRKPLKIFNKFTLRIEIICIDEDAVYWDYKFIKDGFVFCHSIEKSGIYIPGKGMISSREFFHSFPEVKDFPSPPAHILKHMETETEMKIMMSKHHHVDK
jgi:acyl-CoA thioesterase FadM